MQSIRSRRVPIIRLGIIALGFITLIYQLAWGKDHRPKTDRERGEEVVMEYLHQKYHQEFLIFSVHGPNFMDTHYTFGVSALEGKYRGASFEVESDKKNPSVECCRDSYVNYLLEEPYTAYCRRIVNKYTTDTVVFTKIGGVYGKSITGDKKVPDLMWWLQADLYITVFDREDSKSRYKEIWNKIKAELDAQNANCAVHIRCLNNDKAGCLNKSITTKEAYEKETRTSFDDDFIYKWVIDGYND